MNTNDPIVEHEIQQIVSAIPDVRWIRVISVDGLSHPTFRFDAGHIKRDTLTDLEENRISPMTTAALSISERIAYELVLGAAQFSIIGGKTGTHFVFPIGEDSDWVISIGVRGTPSTDAIIRYFAERDYLAHIIPHLKI